MVLASHHGENLKSSVYCTVLYGAESTEWTSHKGKNGMGVNSGTHQSSFTILAALKAYICTSGWTNFRIMSKQCDKYGKIWQTFQRNREPPPLGPDFTASYSRWQDSSLGQVQSLPKYLIYVHISSFTLLAAIISLFSGVLPLAFPSCR